MSEVVPFPKAPRVERFQHHVFYVRDMDRAKRFYTALLDLQISALNHPDSSAAMRLSKQAMQFYSFGYFHHDICLVQMTDATPDNGSVLHFTVEIDDMDAYAKVRRNAEAMGGDVRDGRLLQSAADDGRPAFCIQDPDGQWVEILGARPAS